MDSVKERCNPHIIVRATDHVTQKTGQTNFDHPVTLGLPHASLHTNVAGGILQLPFRGRSEHDAPCGNLRKQSVHTSQSQRAASKN